MLNSIYYAFQVFIILFITLFLFFPKLLKLAIRCHKKVNQLDFSYYPFRLDDVILRYQQKKHIEIQLTIRRVQFTKVLNQWRFRLDLLDCELKYNTHQPIRIGFISDEQLYMDRLKSRFVPYTDQKIRRRRNKQMNFFEILIESTMTNIFYLVLSRLEMHFNWIQVILPRLNSREMDQQLEGCQKTGVPQIQLKLVQNHFHFRMNQNSHVVCSFQNETTALSEGSKTTESVQIQQIELSAIIRPGLTVDMLQEYSSVKVTIQNVIWHVKKEFYYTMDVLANEFYPRPDINKILKRYYNENSFIYLGKPREMELFFVNYKIEFDVFSELAQRYSRPLTFEWKDLYYKGIFNLENDIQTKQAKIECKYFSVTSMGKDIQIFDIKYSQRSNVSNSIHANDETEYDVQYGEVQVNISKESVRYYTMMQTEMGTMFRMHFMENYEQKNYFKKYNKIAKQMCCDFNNVELQNKLKTVYKLRIEGEFRILLSDNEMVNQFTLSNFMMDQIDTLEGTQFTEIKCEECRLTSEFEESNGTIFNIQYLKQENDIKLNVGSSDLRVCHKNIDKLLRLALQHRIFKQKMLKKTSFKQQQQQQQLQPKKQTITINFGHIALSYQCENQALTLSLNEISTLSQNKFSINSLCMNYYNQNNSELMRINNIIIDDELHIHTIAFTLDENISNLNQIIGKIKQSQSILREYNTVYCNEVYKPFNRRRASHDGVLSILPTAPGPKVGKSILEVPFRLYIQKLQIQIHDTKWERFLCKYHHFQRHFETMKSRNNTIKIYEFLEKDYYFPLLNIEFDNIQIQGDPLQMKGEDVLDKITKLDSYPTLLDLAHFDYFQLFQGQLKIGQFKITIRDYHNDILKMNDILFKQFIVISKLNSQETSLALRVFYDLELSFRQIEFALGFNIIHAFQEMFRRIQIILGPSPQTVQVPSQKNTLPFWDRFRLEFHGKFQIMLTKFIAKLLTDTTPYSIDCVKLQLSNISVEYLNWSMKMQADKLKLNRIPKIDRVLYIPRIQAIGEFHWNAKGSQNDHYFVSRKPYFNQINSSLEQFVSQHLKVNVKIDCIQYEYKNELELKYQKRSCFFIHYQNQFMRWLKNRPILRHDYLRMLPLRFQQVLTIDLEQQQHILYADYKSLVQYTYFKLMESLMIKQTLYQHTKLIDIKVYANRCRMFFTNSEKPISHTESYLKNKNILFVGTQLLYQSLKFNIQLEPNCPDGDWHFEVKSIAGKCDQLHGAMFDGIHLLDLDAPQALNQQTEFVKFFDIQPVDFQERISFREIKSLKKFLNNPNQQWINTNVTPQYHLFDTQDQVDQIDESDNDEEFELIMRSRSSKIDKPPIKNSFDGFDIFLQASDLEYEQNKQVELVDDEQKKMSKLIKNFVSAQDTKLLFTFYLQDIWTNIFESLSMPVKMAEENLKQQKVLNKTKEPSYIREELVLLVSLVTPQLNFQYHTANCQMILTSPSDCQIIVSEHFLPFDNYKIDKKIVQKVIFNGLECQMLNRTVDARSKTYFLSNEYDKVLKCDFALFQKQSYALRENARDFTELMQQNVSDSLYWNQELRRDLVQVKVGQLTANFTKYHLDAFLDMVLFFEMVVTTKNELENKERFYRNKLKELNQYGGKSIEASIKKKLGEDFNRYGSEQSKIDYAIKQVNLSLLDEGESAFIQLNIEGVRVLEILYANQGTTTQLVLQNLEIMSRLANTEPEYQVILQQDKKSKNEILKLTKKYFPLQIFQQKWYVIDEQDLQVNPIIIKLTDEVYDKFYEYFFGEDTREKRHSEKKEQIKNATENIHKQIPDFYNNLTLGELKLNATFKHPSKIKRFRDVVVVIEPYKSTKQFSTVKEQFDEFATFIIKQITSQIFSIIGQKLFG